MRLTRVILVVLSSALSLGLGVATAQAARGDVQSGHAALDVPNTVLERLARSGVTVSTTTPATRTPGPTSTRFQFPATGGNLELTSFVGETPLAGAISFRQHGRTVLTLRNLTFELTDSRLIATVAETGERLPVLQFDGLEYGPATAENPDTTFRYESSRATPEAVARARRRSASAADELARTQFGTFTATYRIATA